MGQQHATPSRISLRPVDQQQVLPSSTFASGVNLDHMDEGGRLVEGDLVPVMFKWTHGGQRVALTGTFNQWASAGIPMVRSGQEFYQVVEIPRGVHEYKFLVDNEWKFSLDQPVLEDVGGNVNNVVDIQYYEKYEPAPLKDPLEADTEVEFTNIEMDASNLGEPSTVPPLLMRLPLMGLSTDDLRGEQSLLFGLGDSPAAAVNIPLFSICGHLLHDASMSYRTNLLSSNVIMCATSIRFAQKYSSTVFVSTSKFSTGILRHYGGNNANVITTDSLLVRAIKGTQPKYPPSPRLSEGILRRANSSGSESKSRSRILDLSSFTD